MRVNNRDAGILGEERALIKLSIPKTTQDFQALRDAIYAATKAAIAENKQPKFQGIIEVARSEIVILTSKVIKAVTQLEQTEKRWGYTFSKKITKKL